MKIGRSEMTILEDLSAGDLLVGFLLSCRSTKIMYQVAHKRASTRSHAQQCAERRHKIKNVIQRLEKKNLVSLSTNKKGQKIKLTRQGKKILSRNYVIKKTQNIKMKWDNKWRIVMFDVPVILSQKRNELRKLLQDSGFEQIQQSAYVFPYNFPELTKYLNANRDIGRYCNIFVGKYIGNDKVLRKKFDL